MIFVFRERSSKNRESLKKVDPEDKEGDPLFVKKTSLDRSYQRFFGDCLTLHNTLIIETRDFSDEKLT